MSVAFWRKHARRTVTNATGTVCFSADYYHYGQENDYNMSCSVEFKFTGYEFDSETGNAFFASRMDLRDYYAYARYYNPLLGRFMTPDPLGGSILNPQSLNRYSYVLNNPETFIDPTGLTCWTEQNSVSAEIDVVCTTPPPSPSGLGGLKEAYFSFFSEATGMNGCVLGWCAPTPPSDTFAYTLWAGLKKRIQGLTVALGIAGRGALRKVITPSAKAEKYITDSKPWTESPYELEPVNRPPLSLMDEIGASADRVFRWYATLLNGGGVVPIVVYLPSQKGQSCFWDPNACAAAPSNEF